MFQGAVASVASAIGLSSDLLACLHTNGESPCVAACYMGVPDCYGLWTHLLKMIKCFQQIFSYQFVVVLYHE